MKRSKNDHIRSTISRYFKRRQFHESEMPSRKDGRREQTVEDLTVRMITRNRTGVHNSIALTSISGDPVLTETQFIKLKTFVLGAPQPYQDELQALVFPMFVHTYLEMVANGYAVHAKTFHEKQKDIITGDKKESFGDLLKNLKSKTDILTYKEVSEASENRFLLEVKQSTLEYLMRFLKTEEVIVMLQIFNQCIKVKVMSAAHSHGVEFDPVPCSSNNNDLDPDKVTIKTEVGVAMTLEDQLAAAIKGVRALPPCLPSICFFTFLNTYQGLTSATISPSQHRLAGSFEDSSLTVWHVQPDVFKAEPHGTQVSHIVLGADHVLSTEDEIKDSMNSRTKPSTETAKLMGHRGPVYKSSFLHTSHDHLVSCSEDASVRLWDLNSQANVSMYKGHSSAVWDVAVSNTDSWFASCSHDTTAKLWTFERSYPLRSYVGHTFDVDCVEFHPNNTYLATGSGDKTVRVWSVSEGRCVRLLQGHRGSVLALAFSPDGKLLASAGEDRRIRVWDLGTGRVLKELRGHSETVYSLTFDLQSQVLASGGADCCVRLWDVLKAPAMATSESHSSPELLGAFPTKSALINYLSFSQYNVLLASGASS